MDLTELFREVIKTITADMWPPLSDTVLGEMCDEYDTILRRILDSQYNYETREISCPSEFSLGRRYYNHTRIGFNEDHDLYDVLSNGRIRFSGGRNRINMLIILYAICKWKDSAVCVHIPPFNANDGYLIYYDAKCRGTMICIDSDEFEQDLLHAVHRYYTIGYYPRCMELPITHQPVAKSISTPTQLTQYDQPLIDLSD